MNRHEVGHFDLLGGQEDYDKYCQEKKINV